MGAALCEKVQELKDLTDRAIEYEKTAKEFSKQVAVLEERMKHYKVRKGPSVPFSRGSPL